MKIEFSKGAAGFDEAHEIKKAIHHYSVTVHAGHRSEILETLEQAADEQMQKPEYETLLADAVFDDRIEAQRISRLRLWWESVMGPSDRELEMGRQRMEALDRVQRAEAATFDAVAEMAEQAREIEILKARISELEK
jgi:truncated hemoglobin YjbI